MTQTIRSLDEIRKQGLDALCETLGPVDMVRFLQQFSLGEGNYSEERHQLLDGVTMENVLSDLETIRLNKQEM